MRRLSDALLSDLRKYISYRYSHKSQPERRHLSQKIKKLLKASNKSEVSAFHGRVLRFMSNNQEGMDNVTRLNALAAKSGKGHRVNDITEILNESPESMRKLIVKHGGDMDEVMREHLHGSGD